MIIQVKKLPSGGYNCDVSAIDINPITYKQILDYEKKSADTGLLRIKRDLDLLKIDLKDDFDKISFYDFDMLVLYKKVISLINSDNLNINLNYVCTSCGKYNALSVNVSELNYKPFEQLINKIDGVRLNGVKYHIKFPTLKNAEDVINKVLRYESDIDPKIFLLLCLFDFDSNPNLVKKAIESATRDDILVLEYLHDIYNGCNKLVNTKCKICNSEVNISINSMMTDFFRLLKSNIKLDPTKIILS